jgi:hypothetical protein
MAINDDEPAEGRTRTMARLATLQRLKLQPEQSSRSEALMTVEQMMHAELEAMRKSRDRDEEAA